MLTRRGSDLEEAGYAVTYRDFAGPHAVPDTIAAQAFPWFARR